MTSTKALTLAIAHWERMATNNEHPDEAPNSDQCALCMHYKDLNYDAEIDYDTECYNADDDEFCPISRETLQENCAKTPYGRAANAHEMWKACLEDDLPNEAKGWEAKFRKYATEEHLFLRSLL